MIDLSLLFFIIYKARMASDCFALAVLVCDGYLGPHSSVKTDGRVHHFFSVVSRLPMDLQMVMCNRLFGLRADVVSPANAEASFRKVLWFYYYDRLQPLTDIPQ